jgi:hypothetical protein
MNAEVLRAMQAPLNACYQQDAAAALIALKARGRIGDGLTCRVETRKADAAPGEIATLLKLTERYCVVYQTLRQAPPVAVTHAVGARA